MSSLFPELARTIFFLSSFPLTFRLRMISSLVVLAQHGEVEKALPVARLATQKLLMSVDAVVGLKLLTKTLADKHMARLLSNFVLVRRWKRLESLVPGTTGMNPLSFSLVLCPPTDPIQQQHDFHHKPSLDTLCSRCQQMSTHLHVLLKEDPCLEGEVAY